MKIIESGEKEFNCANDGGAYDEIKPVSETEKILSEINMDNLSPMQAFIILGDLVEKVKS